MKTSKKIFAAATAFAATITFSAVASATVFSVDYEGGIWNHYDDEKQAYGMKFRSDLGKDGFWLVLTDGDNPKGDGTSNAILYGDIENNRITAYTYDGQNNSKSYENGTFLGTYENAFSSAGTHVSGYELTMFSLDVSEINSAFGGDWKGVSIGEEAGIWFHQSAGSNFEYGEDGSIVDYAFNSQMYLDDGNTTTRVRDALDCAGDPRFPTCTSTSLSGGFVGSSSGGTSTGGTTTSGGGSVPAPGGLALIFAGLAGAGLIRRRK